MNYLYLVIEIVFTFLLMFLFYRMGKKTGLYLYLVLMSSIMGLLLFKIIDIFSFQVNLGIPVIMGIFIVNNIIIHRYGLDEIKRIIWAFIIPFVLITVILNLLSLITPSEYNQITNYSYNSLFGYGINNLRFFIGAIISIPFAIWINGDVYYSIRKDSNNILFSNIGSMLIIQFIESLIFIIISYIGMFDSIMLFGMIVIRYLLKIVIGFIGLVPVYMLIKNRDK